MCAGQACAFFTMAASWYLAMHASARTVTLNSAVNIGVSPTSPGAPHISNGVYIGPGAKLWNDITIADGVTIGANACVSKSVTEEGAVVVGTNRVL